MIYDVTTKTDSKTVMVVFAFKVLMPSNMVILQSTSEIGAPK
jgi:hypothetical protein